MRPGHAQPESGTKIKHHLLVATAVLCLTLGAALLAITAIGQIGSQNRKGATSFAALYHAAEREWDTTAPPLEKGAAILRVLRARFTNGLESHTLTSNWILYTLGETINENFKVPRIPDVVLRTTDVLQCGGFSYLGMKLALRAGLTARQVGLNGHVVFEIFDDGAWHMFDPSNNVYADAQGRTYAVSWLEDHAESVAAIYSQTRTPDDVRKIQNIYTSKQDNTFMTIPRGMWFNPKGELYMMGEQAAEWLKWLIPLGLLTAGLTGLYTARRRYS